MNQYQIFLDELMDEIKEDVARQDRYLKEGRRNYQRSLDRHGHLSAGAAKYLYANNGHARARVAKLVFEGVRQMLSERGLNSVLQVTLTPSQGAVAEAAAIGFDPEPMKRLIGKYFGEINMLGIIEPGFYPRIKMGSVVGLVCFHLHGLAWGDSPVRVRKMVEPFKVRHPSIFVNRSSAYVQVVPINDVPKVLKYQYKIPDIGYDLAVDHLEEIDQKTGEVTCWLDPLSQTWKRKLGQGERTRIDNCLRELTFDRLLVGTGEGKEIRKDICAAALEEYNLRHRR